MTNEEFKILMNLEKKFAKQLISLPTNGESCIYDVLSLTTKDKFFLDVDRRGMIELSKFKLQNRYALTKMPLVRIEIDAPPHINPDGSKTSRNHIHIYKETDYDSGNLPWAYDLDTFADIQIETNPSDFMSVFDAFCNYCNISVNNIQGVI